MGYGKPKLQKVILPTDKEYWVELRLNIPYGELKNFAQFGGEDAWLPPAQKILMSITDWNLDDDDGKKLEITMENLDKLQEPDIFALSDALNNTEEEDQKKK